MQSSSHRLYKVACSSCILVVEPLELYVLNFESKLLLQMSADTTTIATHHSELPPFFTFLK